MDLSKKFPGYFNKWLLRSAFIIVAILGVYVLWSNNWNLSPAYVECPIGQYICNNPFYAATGPACKTNSGLCTTAHLMGGETIGNKPTTLMRVFTRLSMGIITIAFILNHLLYLLRGDYDKNN